MKYHISIISLLLLFIGISVVSAQEDTVSVDVGNIPAGQQVTITYQASVNETLPEGTLFIENQGVATGSNFDPVNSDDPQTVVGSDETLTPVGFTLNVVQLPQTGETPLWAMILVSATIALAVTGIAGFIMTRQRTYVS